MTQETWPGHWAYFTQPSTSTVHLARFDDVVKFNRDAKTLCGQSIDQMQAGDDTSSGVAATCSRCRKASNQHEYRGMPVTEPTRAAPELWTAYDEPEMQRLCTEQIRELSAITARHARDRVRLGLRLSNLHKLQREENA